MPDSVHLSRPSPPTRDDEELEELTESAARRDSHETDVSIERFHPARERCDARLGQLIAREYLSSLLQARVRRIRDELTRLESKAHRTRKQGNETERSTRFY